MPSYTVVFQPKGHYVTQLRPWVVLERTWSLFGSRKTVVGSYKTEEEAQRKAVELRQEWSGRT